MRQFGRKVDSARQIRLCTSVLILCKILRAENSGGSRISVRGMRLGSGPNFFRKGWLQLFHGIFFARTDVARIFRGWVRPGVDPGFLVGGRWRGLRPRIEWGAKRRSAEGVRSVEGCRSPSLVWGSGSMAPRKFLKFNLQICTFWCIFAPVSDAEFNATCSNFGSLGGRTPVLPPP